MSSVALDSSPFQPPLETKTDETTSMLSTSTDSDMTELADEWMASDVKNLKYFPDGPTQSFMEMPESRMSKPLKYVYQRYSQSLKAHELEAKFECMFGVSDLLKSGEWPKFIEFFSADEKLELIEKGFWPPCTNTLRARFFDRYKDKTIHLYVQKKAEEKFETQFSRVKNKEEALQLSSRLQSMKTKSSLNQAIYQRKNVFDRVNTIIRAHVFGLEVTPLPKQLDSSRPTLVKIPESERNAYVRWICSVDPEDDMILSKVKRQEWLKVKIVDMNEVKGKGVVATEDIPKGEIVCDYHGRYLSFKQHQDHNKDEGDDFNKYMMELPSYLTLVRKSNHTVLDFETLTSIDASSGFCPCHPKHASKGRFINHAKIRQEDNNLKLESRLVEFDGHKNHLMLLRTRRFVTAGEEPLYEYNDILSF